MTSSNPIRERWLPVVGYEGLYEVSSWGRVRGLDRKVSDGRRVKGVMLKPCVYGWGHLKVNLWKDNVQRTKKVHQLVLEAFVGPRPDGMECRHLDGNPENNHLENIRWGTKVENRKDMTGHGNDWQSNKTHCPHGHPLKGANLAPHQLKRGRRQCLACNRAHSYLRKHPELKPQFQEIADSYFSR